MGSAGPQPVARLFEDGSCLAPARLLAQVARLVQRRVNRLFETGPLVSPVHRPVPQHPAEAAGRCHLTVEGDSAKGRDRSGVEVIVEGGAVVRCAADLASEPGQYATGSTGRDRTIAWTPPGTDCTR